MTSVYELTALLADRYLIERQIGEGGMATVYLALDVRHQRKVALKVLKPELAAVVGAERFLNEIRVTARLQHTNIIPLFDSGEAAGVPYYVMPFVNGESLRERLRRSRQLPVTDAVRIATGIANALDHAHRHGVVHRDLKPENILIVDDQPIVADFGIARALSTAGAERLTLTGVCIGTPQYMSPEQAAGEHDVDARADLYSLGAVTYEMITGEPPHTGPTAQAVIARIITEHPRSLSATRPGIPANLDSVVTKALAKAPADRWGSAREFVQALAAPAEPLPIIGSVRPATRLLVAGALIAAVALAATLVARSASPQRTAAPPRIAVLPFENLGSSGDRPFSDGLTEEVTSRLAEIGGLRVVSRTSAARFSGKSLSMKSLGDSLHADFILEGTVRTDHSGSAGLMRVTPQLIRVSDDVHVWQHSYDASLAPGELLRVQADIASQVAAGMNVTLLAGERMRVAKATTTDSAALLLYQLGRFQWQKRTPESLLQAQRDFREAIHRDPTFARAYAGLGDALFVYGLTVAPDSGPRIARQVIDTLRQAVRLDPELAEAWAGLGYALTFGTGELSAADSALRQAIAIDPSYPPAHYWLAQLLFATGTDSAAMHEAREAVALDPLSAVAHFVAGMTAAIAGQRDDALAAYQRAIDLQPQWPIARFYLCLEQARRGQLDSAELHARVFVEAMAPTKHVDQSLPRRLALGAGGKINGSAVLKELDLAGVPIGDTWSALFFANAGNADSAIGRLRQTFQRRSLGWIPMTEFVRPDLSNDPRWQALIRRVPGARTR